MWCNGPEGVVLDLRQKRPDDERESHESDCEDGAENLVLSKHQPTSNPIADGTYNHSQKLPLNCPDCGKSFSHSSSLKRHSRTHSGVRPFICNICNKGFHYKNNLQDHARTHTGEKPFKCPDCGQSFAQSSTLNRHIGTHGKEKTCQICGKAFVKFNMLQKHLSTHLNKEELEGDCNDQKQMEVTSEDIKSLNKKQKKTDNEKFDQDHFLNCVKCGMKFDKSGDLQQHLWTHVGEGQALFYELTALNGLLSILELMQQGAPLTVGSLKRNA